MTEQLSGAEILLRSLVEENVEYVFGYPGGAALHIYDALFQHKQIEHILVRHEQAATHMADGYARSTGRPGVVLVTSGPGATNAITGIATAYMDSIPLVVLSAQVATTLIGTDAFQETDMVGVSRPIVKYNMMVSSPKDMAYAIRKAFYIATSGRPGPVVVDIPKNVTDPSVLVPYQQVTEMHLRSYNPSERGHRRQIQKAVKAIMTAKQPIVYYGGGVVQGNASEQLRKFCRLIGCPVVSTLMGLGGYPSTDKLHLGMLGMHGTYEANNAMHHSDLIIAIAARFDDRVTNNPKKFCPGATIIHIDIDPATISKIIQAHIPIVGLADSILSDLLSLMEKEKFSEDKSRYVQWWSAIENWKKVGGLDHNMKSKSDPNKPILPQVVIQEVYRATGGNAFVTSDVGQHQMFAAQYYHFDLPRRWINSGGLGTMGFGVPSAMGVQLAHKDACVVCVTGEGSLMMNIQELSTCLQYAFPIKIINLNNRALGMVKQWQDMQYGGRHSNSTYADALPDFIALTEAFGHVGFRIDDLNDLSGVLDTVFSEKYADKLVLVDIWVDPDEHVYPMALKDGAMDEMLLSKVEQEK